MDETKPQYVSKERKMLLALLDDADERIKNLVKKEEHRMEMARLRQQRYAEKKLEIAKLDPNWVQPKRGGFHPRKPKVGDPQAVASGLEK